MMHPDTLGAMAEQLGSLRDLSELGSLLAYFASAVFSACFGFGSS
jgi:hypothetical protein